MQKETQQKPLYVCRYKMANKPELINSRVQVIPNIKVPKIIIDIDNLPYSSTMFFNSEPKLKKFVQFLRGVSKQINNHLEVLQCSEYVGGQPNQLNYNN